MWSSVVAHVEPDFLACRQAELGVVGVSHFYPNKYDALLPEATPYGADDDNQISKSFFR